MTLKELKSFEVKRLEILSPDGTVDKNLMPELNDQTIKEMYESMVLTRVFDDTAFRMQREGRLGTYAQTYGQEAQVGVAFAMSDDDWFFPSFREHGIMMRRGVTPELLLQYFAGDFSRFPDNVNCMPVTIPVGTHIPHAVGVAWAFKLKEEKKASVVCFGDGATSKGDFHEGMNFAGTFQVPCVFVCQNNQWAISMPRSKQTRAETIAQKAVAYGFEGMQVDGNDVFAVYSAVNESLAKAYEGNGPTLIEMDTYRMGHHTTSDDATRYREPEEVKDWAKRDPIDRLKKFMEQNGIWSQDYEKGVMESAEKIVSDGATKEESRPQPKPEDIFNNVFAELPNGLKEQRDYLLKIYKK